MTTHSRDTLVVMSRELNQRLEKDSDNRLVEGWGEVMKWMDLCAAISSVKHAKTGKLVTAQVDDMRIMGPLIYGDMLTVRGQVTNSWNSSMEVEVILEAENLLSEAEPRVLCQSYFTFVALKPPGEPYKLPKLIPSCPTDEQKLCEALERRQIRFRRKEFINETSLLMSSPSLAEKWDEVEGKGRKVKLMSDSCLSTAIVVLPSHANPHGNTFGGEIMGWMEETAKLVSRRHTRRKMYLCHIDDIRFIKPSRAGDWLTVKAQVNRVFGGTLEVGVRVEARSFSNGGDTEVVHINSGYYTYSCSPPSILPEEITLPLVRPTTEKEIKQYHDAIGRRRVRVQRSAISNKHDLSIPVWDSLLSMDLVYSNVKDILEVSLSNSLHWWGLSSTDGIDISISDSKSITIVKIECNLVQNENGRCKSKLSAANISPAFLDYKLRSTWDTFLDGFSLVQVIDASNDIYHVSLRDDKSQTDLCLLRSWRTPETGLPENQYIISSRSIQHPDVPEKKGIQRGNVLPSGFILSDEKDGSIKVTYVLQMTGSALKFTLQNIPDTTLQRFKKLKVWFASLESPPTTTK